jgi:hypothetical protein
VIRDAVDVELRLAHGRELEVRGKRKLKNHAWRDRVWQYMEILRVDREMEK